MTPVNVLSRMNGRPSRFCISAYLTSVMAGLLAAVLCVSVLFWVFGGNRLEALELMIIAGPLSVLALPFIWVSFLPFAVIASRLMCGSENTTLLAHVVAGVMISVLVVSLLLAMLVWFDNDYEIKVAAVSEAIVAFIPICSVSGAVAGYTYWYLSAKMCSNRYHARSEITGRIS